MNVIKAGYEIISPIDSKAMLKHIELCGRVCYKSEGSISEDSYLKFVQSIVNRGHEAVIEHASFSVKFIVDRGVSHEIVRHRMASYCQESTRYCNYSGDKFGREITVIAPFFYEENSAEWDSWHKGCLAAEQAYFSLIDGGSTPQEARSVLPNSLKTELIMTANLREWRHFFKLRTAKGAHPQIREVAIPLLKDLQARIPIIFDDLDAEVDR